MRIESRFTTNVVSKLLTWGLQKKLGYKVKLTLNEANATVIDGKTHIHLDLDADLEKDELTRILASVGL